MAAPDRTRATMVAQTAPIAALLLLLLASVLLPSGKASASALALTSGGTPAAIGTPRPAAPTGNNPPGPSAPTAPPTMPTSPVGPPPGATPITVQPTDPPRGATPTTAFFPSPAAPSATATRVPAGTLSAVVAGEFQPLAFTLNGQAQIARTTLTIAVRDDSPTTLAPGWTLSLTMAQFRVVGQPTRTLPPEAITLVGVTIDCAGAACTMPENLLTYPRHIPAGATVPLVVAAPESGSGQFTITPIFAVAVPGNAHSGNYATTIGVDIAR